MVKGVHGPNMAENLCATCCSTELMSINEYTYNVDLVYLCDDFDNRIDIFKTTGHNALWLCKMDIYLKNIYI